MFKKLSKHMKFNCNSPMLSLRRAFFAIEQPRKNLNGASSIIIALIVIMFTSVAWGSDSTEEVNVNSSANNNAIPAAKVTNDKSVISPLLNDLPNNYSDINAIKKYSAVPETNNDLNMVMQQLDDLQNSYQLLKRQLSSKDRAPEKFVDPNDQQAKTSNLFFNGLGTNAEPLKPELMLEREAKLRLRDNPNETTNPYTVKPNLKYSIQSGTIIHATLVTGIDSTVPGTVIAHVRRDVFDSKEGKYLLIPKGSKAIGEYNSRNISAGQSRVALNFNRIIRPDGSSIQLDKFDAGDLQGSAGLEGDVDSHWGQVIGASVLSALINYSAGRVSDRVGNDSTNKHKEYAGSQQRAIDRAGDSISNVAGKIADRALSMPPTIKLPAGKEFTISVKKDLLLTPYNQDI